MFQKYYVGETPERKKSTPKLWNTSAQLHLEVVEPEIDFLFTFLWIFSSVCLFGIEKVFIFICYRIYFVGSFLYEFCIGDMVWVFVGSIVS